MQIIKRGDIIYLKKDKLKSSLSPSAQTASLLSGNTKLNLQFENVVDVIVNGEASRITERVLCDLMLSGGLRISEVLQHDFLKVNRLGQVFIYGCKGSNNKFVTPIYFRQYWFDRVGNFVNPFMHISRFSFYHWCKSVGIGFQNNLGEKMSVTHAFRHLHVYMNQLMDLSAEELASDLGHKSNRSIKYYMNGYN